MRLARLFRSDSYSCAVARLIAAVFTGEGFVFLVGEADIARVQVLDRVASELAELRCRVVRVAAREADELSLHSFVAQLTQQLGSNAEPGDPLERNHRRLTEADASCDRIALLIDRAHLLDASALRFIQLTCRSGPALRVVLASKAAGPASVPEFTLLQTRSSPCIDLDLPMLESRRG